MAAGIIKIGTCLKCGKTVYADNVHGAPTNSNILLQSCKLGGDCEVKDDIKYWEKEHSVA